MRKRYQVYKCEICGNIVQILHGGVGSLVCCNKPMKLITELSGAEEQGFEKHVPVVEHIENGIKVKVGSTPHPMNEDHFIEWIEIIDGDNIYRKHLEPDTAPEAVFDIKSENIIVREYCSVHSMWKN